MKNTLKKKLAFGAVLSVLAAPALAANSVDVSVVGTIAPGSCDVTLGGGGRIDHGTISQSSLDATDYTVLPVKSLPISITCTAPTSVAISTSTQRPNTTASEGADSVNGSAPSPMPLFSAPRGAWGLGLSGTSRIGGFWMRVNPTSVLIDGATVESIDSSNLGGSWGVTGSGGVSSGISKLLLSWAATATPTVPLAFTNMSGTLDVATYINKKSELDLTAPIRLDGLNTIELYYL